VAAPEVLPPRERASTARLDFDYPFAGGEVVVCAPGMAAQLAIRRRNEFVDQGRLRPTGT
jgi:hypothetical protein